LTIAFLMNCKGMVELIVLNIGLEVGIINTAVFTIMVIMTLVTNFMTSPVVYYLYQPQIDELNKTHHREGTDIEMAAPNPYQIRVLLCLTQNTTISPLMDFMDLFYAANTTEISVNIVRLKPKDDITNLSAISRSSLTELGEIVENFPNVKNVSLSSADDIISVVKEHSHNIVFYPFQLEIETENESIMKALLEFSPATVGIFHSSPSTAQDSVSTAGKIFIPFFGGPNDREAVSLGLSLSATVPVEFGIYRRKTAEPDNEDENFIDLVKQRIESSNSKTLSIFTRQYTTPFKGVRAVKKHISEEYKLVILGRKILEGVKENPNAAVLGTIAAELLSLTKPPQLLVMQKSERSPKYINGLKLT